MATDPARIATRDPVEPLKSALGNIAKAQESAKQTSQEIAASREQAQPPQETEGKP